MIVVLLCASESLDEELRQTVLYRHDVQRYWARDVGEARAHVTAMPPDIALVDSALPEAAGVVAALRDDPRTGKVPIVMIARGDPADEGLLEAGATVVLHLPPNREWDTRLVSLVNAPVRREARVPINLHLTAEVPVPALVLNLSLSGMRVLCFRRLQVGDELHFSFCLPGRTEMIQGAATVVRVVGENQYGVELIQIEGEGRRLIQEFFEPGSNVS